jgi:hypothetical protein
MTGSDALQAVQFVTVNGKRLAVLDQDDWEALIDWIETLEDRQIVQQAQAALAAANGDRERAGWLRWDDVKDQLS